MKAARPVFLGEVEETHHDLDMGAGQDEYSTLPTTAIRRNSGEGHGDYFVTVSRWKLTDDERNSIINGADIVHQVIHTIGAYPPMNLQIVDADQDPILVR